MNLRTTFVLLVVTATLGACAPQPTPEQMRQRHLHARGGEAALQNMKVIERVGTFTLHGGAEVSGSYRACVKYPDRAVIDVNAVPAQIHQVLGEHGALECDDAFEHCVAAGAETAEDLKITAQRANREELNEHLPADGIELIRENGSVVGYRYGSGKDEKASEFAPDTGLKRWVKSGSRERRYSDWKDAGGVLLPMRLDDFQDGEPTASVTLTSAKLSETPGEWCAARLAASEDLPQKGP